MLTPTGARRALYHTFNVMRFFNLSVQCFLLHKFIVCRNLYLLLTPLSTWNDIWDGRNNMCKSKIFHMFYKFINIWDTLTLISLNNHYMYFWQTDLKSFWYTVLNDTKFWQKIDIFFYSHFWQIIYEFEMYTNNV